MRRRILILSMPIFIWACFFVFSFQAQAATENFILSGGPQSTDNFCVDDDIYVYLNETLIYADIDHYSASCNNQPVHFQANSGDKLRVVAIDAAGFCRGIGPLWLYYGNQSINLENGVDGGCANWPAGVTFYDKIFDLPQVALDPVILVPGIMGSSLNLGDLALRNEIWPNPLEYASNILDAELNNLEMDSLGNSINRIEPIDIIRSVMGIDFYGGLINYLKANGYEENKNLFVFPYDWRLDLDSVAGDNSPCVATTTLKCLIDGVKKQTGSDKVDIIAHSMGGLVVKDYVYKFGQDSIDKFIDIATPHLGAPDTAKILEYGDNLNIGIFVNGFGVAILNEKKIQDISLQMSSIYQLLPSQKYFNISDNGYGYYLYNNSKIGGSNLQGELNYENSLLYLTASNDKITPYFINKNSLLHSAIDNININNSYNISGCGIPTIGRIKNLGKKAFLWDKYGLEYVDGDGTVPLKSADYFGDKKYYFSGKDHSKIPGADGVKQLVLSILNNKENSFNFSQYNNLKTDDSICSISGKVIEYHCLVDMHIYDDQGNHTGPTGNGDIENNIPGVQYDIIDGNKFVFLPADGNYRITGEAIGVGTLEVAIKTVENNQYTKTEYFNSIPLQSASTRTEINLISGQDNPVIKVDENGDGVFEEEKIPDTVLTGDEMNDLVKPVTNINIASTKGNNNYYISDVKVSLTATDDNSGVLKTEYSLDGGEIWIKYEEEFTVFQDGTTTILYSSTDRAGNREENKQITFSIDQTKPTINILLPQAGQEILRNAKLDIEYFADDNFSGIATDSVKFYLDNQSIASTSIDLFRQSLGQHKIKITIQDLAGNQVEQTVNFYLITDIDGTIADVNRVYDEKMITKIEAKKDLVNDLTNIKTFQEKYGQRIDKEKEMRAKAMAQCLKHKNQAWCDKKIGTIFNRFEYQLSKMNQVLIKLKYNLILSKLDIYLKIKWINQAGYNIIKEDIKYLINKV